MANITNILTPERSRDIVLSPRITRFLDRLGPVEQERVLTTRLIGGRMSDGRGAGCLLGAATGIAQGAVPNNTVAFDSEDTAVAFEFDRLCLRFSSYAVQQAIRGYLLVKRAEAGSVPEPSPLAEAVPV